MYCRNCGTLAREDSTFCSNCGKIVDDRNTRNYTQSNQNEQTPGKNYIKISSIVYFACIGISLLLFLTEPVEYDFPGRYLFFSTIGFIYTIYGFVMGIKHCNNLSKASDILNIGRAMLAINIALWIWCSTLLGFMECVDELATIIILIFYLIGASKNRKHYFNTLWSKE